MWPFSGGHILEKGPPPPIGQECAPSALSYDKIQRGKIRPRFLGFSPYGEDRAVLCVWPHYRKSCGSPCGRLVGATSWKRVPPEIGQECAPSPLSYDKI